MLNLQALYKVVFELDTKNRSALFFGCLALILFLPFLFGKFALGGTDLIYNHYPNLLFGYREFQKFGEFSLWNRYIFGGVDFSRSIHAHFLNPFYWPLLFFPEKYFFHALTAIIIIINALTGWFWSRIATRLGVFQVGSIVVGVVAQAGMYFWFTVTTLIAVQMSFFATLAIHVILSRDLRGNLANYLMLSFTLGMVFVTPHPAYLLGVTFPIIAVFLCSVYPGWLHRPWHGFSAIFVAAGITAFLLAAYRIVPVGLEIVLNGNALADIWSQPLPSGPAAVEYFTLTAFNPSSLGLHISQALHLSSILGFSSHNQFHNALYFGVVPLVIVYFAVRSSSGSKFILPLAVVYLVVQLQFMSVFQPVTDIIDTLLSPFLHNAIFRLSTNFAFLFLLIHCIKRFVDIDRSLFAKLIKEFVFLTGFVLMAGIVLYNIWAHSTTIIVNTFGYKNIANFFRIALLVVLALIFYISTFANERFRTITLTAYILIVSSLILGITIICVGFNLIPGSESFVSALKNSLAVLLVCVSVLFSMDDVASKGRKAILSKLLPGGALALLVMPASLLHPYLLEKELLTFALSSIVGWGVFVALVVTSMHLLTRYARGDIQKNALMASLLALTLVDMVAAFGTYSYVNVPQSPFVGHIEDIYPSNTLPVVSNMYEADLKGQDLHSNLFTNPEFQFVSGSPNNWSLGGVNITLCPPTLGIVKRQQINEVCIYYPSADRGGNFYQDVDLPDGVKRAAAGVWVMAPRGMGAGLFITTPPSKDVWSPVVTFEGDDKWHWISTAMLSVSPLKHVRVHVNLSKEGHIEIYAPRLVVGSAVLPDMWPKDSYVIDEIKKKGLPKVDLASYRVNHVTAINGWGGETLANYAIVADTPTYGGVDSDQPKDFVDFISTFKEIDSSWFNRAGVVTVLEAPRFLDLFGVAYDTDALQGVIERPNAIPRFAAFSNYEVLNQQIGLQRLKDVEFDPTKTLVLGSQPVDALPAVAARRFQRLDYRTPKADHLSTTITDEMPRIILFNDRFSPNWQAYWNGNPLQIVRANNLFMAVSVPSGSGELSFIFRPWLFMQLARISAIVAGLLLLFWIVGFLWPRTHRLRSHFLCSAKRLFFPGIKMAEKNNAWPFT